MWSSLKEYHRPASIHSALRLLGRDQVHTAPLAGGTWLVARRDPSIQAVVDISGLDLAFIAKSTRRLRLGAMTTLQTLAEHPQIQEVAGGMLARAIRRRALAMRKTRCIMRHSEIRQNRVIRRKIEHDGKCVSPGDGQMLIVNLPGSPKAVREGMEVLAPILPSAIALIKDETPLDGLCMPH
jgi:hypothetical protein